MRQTPLHAEHLASGGKVVDFHGWALPVQFEGIIQEHLHTRTQVALFDCSHMGEFTIHGADAIDRYERLVITDVGAIKVGRGKYGAFLNDKGRIIAQTYLGATHKIRVALQIPKGIADRYDAEHRQPNLAGLSRHRREIIERTRLILRPQIH